jgi:quinol monooxygenase YgiN
MAKVRVIARAQAVAGKRDELKAVLKQLVAPTRAEKGCIYYQLFESTVPDVLIFNEEWASAEDLQAHASTERMASVQAEAAPFRLGATEVNILTIVE